LTEPFRQLGTARTGDGLGLSIAASVAQAHGGRLVIDPLEQGGLRVSIALPQAPVSGPTPGFYGALRSEVAGWAHVRELWLVRRATPRYSRSRRRPNVSASPRAVLSDTREVAGLSVSRSIGALEEDDPVRERLIGGREHSGDERAAPGGAA
jgi:hypothetical protein